MRPTTAGLLSPHERCLSLADDPTKAVPLRISRRELLCRSLSSCAAFTVLSGLLANSANRRFKIGACDWSLGKMDDPQAFKLAREIGLDGVQVSLGTEANQMHLRQASVQSTVKAAARDAGVEVASVAIGELNNIPYKRDPRTVAWVEDCIDVCTALGVRVILLAFFGNDDLRDDPDGIKEVVRRLKAVAPKAEKAGVALGIESWLSAEQHLRIIDQVGSSAVRVYYDVCNSNDRGYDIYQEIRQLGKHICEFHAKENGALLGKGKVNFQKVREAMDAIGYAGWIQIEGAVPPGQGIFESYRSNRQFMRQVFSA
jgi:L-ribulose-5-phosphate 3-epimerase